MKIKKEKERKKENVQDDFFFVRHDVMMNGDEIDRGEGDAQEGNVSVRRLHHHGWPFYITRHQVCLVYIIQCSGLSTVSGRRKQEERTFAHMPHTSQHTICYYYYYYYYYY